MEYQSHLNVREVKMYLASNASNSASFTLQPGSSSAEIRLSQDTSAAPCSRDEYYAIWDAWERSAPPGGNEQRAIAAERMRECLEKQTKKLNLNSLNLSSLPDVLPENVEELRIDENQLTCLPARLPQNLQSLFASENKLTALPDMLPEKLINLFISRNQLQTLPDTLPDSIRLISACNNSLEELPRRFPSSLREATFDGNNITSLDVNFPDRLEELDISNNQLSSLPDNLPDSIKRLYATNNRLEGLPDRLPSSLKEAYFSVNNIASLDVNFPDRLEELDISNNQLSSLPDNLPDSIKYLYATNNRLEGLPDRLPSSLKNANFTGNNIVSLNAALPDILERLWIDKNRLSCLPDNLPDSIKYLYASNNRLEGLPGRLPSSLMCAYVCENNITSLDVNLPDSLEKLDISNNQLSSLPDNLPDSITHLYASNNRLEGLPDRLPSSLREAMFAGNNITSLDVNFPDRLRELDISNNQLSSLPDNLPLSLQYIYLRNNQLSSLSDNLPLSLQYIDLRNNQLETLSPAVTRLSRRAVVEAEGNPLSQQTIIDLLSPGYTGPEIRFPVLEEDHNAAPRPLSEAVKSWLPEELYDNRWEQFESEQYAESFSIFLNRLIETVNSQVNPYFRERIVAWLLRLADNASLRERTFMLSNETTTDCQDRVTFYWHEMQKAVLTHDVESGTWDNRLPDLIAAGREMFRLEVLEQIARKKVEEIKASIREIEGDETEVDEIEVDAIETFLAYQIGLREELSLSSTGEAMRFMDVSGVTKEDLKEALCQVRKREQREFTDWLAQWEPFKKAISRSGSEFVQAIQKKQAEAFENVFLRRVEETLKADNLAGIPDAEAGVGKKIHDDMQRVNDVALTRAYLQDYYYTRMAEGEPDEALETVAELASVAALTPPLAAAVVRPDGTGGNHPGSLLAGIVARNGMAPLADAWISLLGLLYEHQSLSREDIVSALLPQEKDERTKSLAHAITGAAWSSDAATKLATLLSDVASKNVELRPEIINRLSLKQPGYDFRQLKLNERMDFYKRAKWADRISPNDAAKARLRAGGLIPENRELYKLASASTSAPAYRQARAEALAQWIKKKGNWAGDSGDYAPGIISRLYPNVRLKINVLNAQGELDNVVESGDDSDSARRTVELNLQNTHYSPIINGKQQDAPADGDCFFYSFLAALSGKAPSDAEVQRLRTRLADYIRDNNDEMADFIHTRTAPGSASKDKRDIQDRENPELNFVRLYKKIETEIIPQVKAYLAERERERAELEQAKKSAETFLKESREKELEENKKRVDDMLLNFAAHHETQGLLHDRRQLEKAAAWQQLQKEKQERDQERVPSWKGYVLPPSGLFFTSQTPHTKKTGGTDNVRAEDWASDLEQRFNTLRNDSKDFTSDLEQRLDALRNDPKDFTSDLEQRLDALRNDSKDFTSDLEQRLDALRKDFTGYSIAQPLKKD